jgi:hypothetical protein
MKTTTQLLSLLVLSIGLVFAQGSSTGSSQLNFPMSARPASLGGAVIADIGSYSSSSINPANLWTEEPLSVLLSHSQWIQDIQTEVVGIQMPFSFGTFGLAVLNSNVRGIEIREVPGPPLGSFTARLASFQAGFATKVSDGLFVGGALKYLYEKLYVDEATGFGLDLGATYRTPVEGLTAGISMTNIGELGEFRTDPSQLPGVARLGVGYKIQYRDFSFGPSVGVANELYRNRTHAQLGLETVYDHALALRLGYETGYESRGFTAGLGFSYSIVQLDYAYVPFSLGLGEAHIFSMGFQF